MFKRRLDLDGKPIAEPVKHEIGEQDVNTTTVASDNKEEGKFGVKLYDFL